MYSMGTDWNQVMAQYGTFLSEDDATQFRTLHLVLCLIYQPRAHQQHLQ
jgi:hypothetical protein